MSGDAPGFFSRWSQRKAGKLPDATGAAPDVRDAPAEPDNAPTRASNAPPTRTPAQAGTDARTAPAAPPPTLADVAQLRSDSDFSPFVRQGIAPAVKNAAMKKLFADPHFNVMDGLDTYIDDYSIPSPLSPQDLKKMVAAQFIKLVEAEEPPPVQPSAAAPTSVAEPPTAEPPHTATGAPPVTPAALNVDAAPHAHTDARPLDAAMAPPASTLAAPDGVGPLHPPAHRPT